MADHLKPASRSKVMRAIRSQHTKPELLVRKLLYSQGYRYRIHDKSLPGKPDIVFKGKQKAIFIHGCFWHQHSSKKCKIVGYPASNLEYWKPKLERTKQRDKQNIAALKKNGWEVLVLWECQLSNPDMLQNILEAFLENKPH